MELRIRPLHQNASANHTDQEIRPKQRDEPSSSIRPQEQKQLDHLDDALESYQQENSKGPQTEPDRVAHHSDLFPDESQHPRLEHQKPHREEEHRRIANGQSPEPDAKQRKESEGIAERFCFDRLEVRPEQK